ncbi:MAG: NUDIX hydrolase [Lactobacillus iners]|nr:NUDIX hydrolase [Lactobacillus iners]MCT7809993.1 NUDIX hydrolase [Lactobacillus iners]MCT7813862.1 NUDIX hydrolase [Lactobacillus iners]MCT7830088.1 NUDIX hydrolase [Lactobacillus iners]MCT7844163.1 NUDIX hydrolase [Lactobacillus iners]
MNSQDLLIEWAKRLQSVAQAGLTYGKDKFDIERYQEIRNISAEIMAQKSDIPLQKVKDLFCNEVGYQTPKIATRAAIFKDQKILLVQENNGTWSIPGGWCEVNLSIKENCIKEAKEESGMDIEVDKVIALHDLSKHSSKEYPYGVLEIFFLCKPKKGHFEKNTETIDSKYFSINELPKMSSDKGSKKQAEMCFKALNDPAWSTHFE